MTPFRLIVAGGRDFDNRELFVSELEKLCVAELVDYNVILISGMAKGADLMAYNYALQNQVEVASFPANWNEHGKAAGHIRNREMGDFADGLLAFWDGKSRGTQGMIQYMRKLEKPVRVVHY